MSMLRHRQRAGSDAEARLLLSARRPDDVLFADELSDARVDPVITYTREAPPGWTGYARRVDRAMLEEAALSPDRMPRIFVCGPTGLVEGVAEDLVALGHDAGADQNRALRRNGRLTMDTAELRLDGNAVAGMLGEMLSVDATTVLARCGGCGAEGALGEAEVYLHCPGVVCAVAAAAAC